MTQFTEIFEIVTELQERRTIPQFMFFSPISIESMISTREQVLAFKAANPDAKQIDVIVNSPGGSPSNAYRIIRTFRNHFEEVNIIVPFWAKSAATLMSLGATKIIMDEFGEFGPLDIQIGVERDDSPEINMESALTDENTVKRIEIRARELYQQMFIDIHSDNNVRINKVELSKQILDYISNFYKPLLSQINPYSLGRKKRMLDIGEQYARRILSMYNQHMPMSVRNILIDYLVNECPDHGFVIDYHFISRFMPNVHSASELSKEYQQTLQKLSTIMINLSDDIEFVGFLPSHSDNNGTDDDVPIVEEGKQTDPNNQDSERKTQDYEKKQEPRNRPGRNRRDA